MPYIQFDKKQLVNLGYSLSKEFIRANRSGSFSGTTIIGCNTRKYHGLLISPQPAIDNGLYVLLSSIDETIIQHEAEFNFGIHKYKGGEYNPKGHKYITDVTTEPIPKICFSVGGVVLTKEMLFLSNEDRVIIKYTLEKANSETTLRLKPFLAFRNVHSLSKANIFAERKYEEVENGIKTRMYQGYSYLNMQVSKETEYTHVPDWYYDIEYEQERDRGYDSLEDLYVPGFFDVKIKKGESVYFTAGLNEMSTASLSKQFNAEIKKRTPRDNFENCLINSAQQFIVRKGKKVEIMAGYPWFGRWGRDTFIAVPGLTIAIGDIKTCKEVIDTMIEDLNGPLFPNVGSGSESSYNSVDASLWFFWALQQYAYASESEEKIWKEYGAKMKMILVGYRKGTQYNIKMHDNGLIWSGETGKALTWMDAIAEGKPVTPRIGFDVEINALWYNAIMFSLEMAAYSKDTDFFNEWDPIAKIIPASYKETFWSKAKGYLADYVNGDFKDWTIRPNQIFAASLPYNPLSEKIRQIIIETTKKVLLTPKGIRTLAPHDLHYKGHYQGDQTTRDQTYHQGTVWPWLLGAFADAYLKIYGDSGVNILKKILNYFETDMLEYGIGSIAEIYDGDPPHHACGAPSQAWSVAELLRINKMIKDIENRNNLKKK